MSSQLSVDEMFEIMDHQSGISEMFEFQREAQKLNNALDFQLDFEEVAALQRDVAEAVEVVRLQSNLEETFQQDISEIVETMNLQADFGRIFQQNTVDISDILDLRINPDLFLIKLSVSQEVVKDISQDIEAYNDLIDFIEREYRETNFEEYPTYKETRSLEDREIYCGMSTSEKIRFTAGGLRALIADLIQDQYSVFVMAYFITAVVIPLILNDPEISEIEDIVARIEWALVIAYWIISDN